MKLGTRLFEFIQLIKLPFSIDIFGIAISVFCIYDLNGVVAEPSFSECVDEYGTGWSGQNYGHDGHRENYVSILDVGFSVRIADAGEFSCIVEDDAAYCGLNGGLGDP